MVISQTSSHIPMPVITQLQAVYQKDPNADRVALVWPEPLLEQQSVVSLDGHSVKFVYCVSELAIREALVEHEKAPSADRDRLVVLSRFDEVHLAKDVLARLWKNEPQRISPWKTLQQLIRVRDIDPRLTKKSGRWMAEALLGCFDRYQGKISFGEVLDQEKAWQALALGYLNYREPVLDLESILAWSQKSGAEAAIDQLPKDVADNLNDWLEPGLPLTHDLVVALLVRGHADELLPIGLCCSVLFSSEIDQQAPVDISQLHVSRGVFRERYLSGQTIAQSTFQHLGKTATNVVKHWLTTKDYKTISPMLSKAEQILASLDLLPAAKSSNILACGFQSRLDELAAALDKVLAGQELSGDKIVAAEKALELARQHSLAHLSNHRETLNRANMAVRLVRWLNRQAEPIGDAASLIAEFVEHGSFADWARSDIWSGDVHDGLNSVYQQISNRVRSSRDKENHAFAQKLAGIAKGDNLPASLIPVENTIERLLAPLSEHTPVLLLVLDGMSEAVYRELAEDLYRNHWLELRSEGEGQESCLVAALPTTTQVSRCSLLSGKICEGAANDEKNAFSANPLLKKVASTKFPPSLFHKQDLSGDGSGSLHGEVRSKIAGTEYRVLAAVVNAIDDQLSSSSQVSIDWSLDSIALLRQIMEAAREAGRVVILTSDHGHVLDHDSVFQQASADNGERYQLVSGGVTPSELEIEVSGKRVATPEQSVIMPWSERLRYTKSKSRGYHGGASLQEVVIPLGVFINASTDSVPDGWQEVPRKLPEWWNREIANVSDLIDESSENTYQVTKGTKKTAKAKLVEAASEVMEDLFGQTDGADEAEATSSVDVNWVDQLLESSVYQQVKARAGRSAIRDEQLHALITLLGQQNWQAMEAVVIRELQIPKIRLRGFLAGAQKLLNVDGYPILSVDRESQTIKINVSDLKKQFEI